MWILCTNYEIEHEEFNLKCSSTKILTVVIIFKKIELLTALKNKYYFALCIHGCLSV